MVANETNIHSIRYRIRITKLHKWNGTDICLTNNHLPDFSFISLISESETNETIVELHPKLKLINILKLKQDFF